MKCPTQLPEVTDHYAYLMQFADGNRIDLILLPGEQARSARDDSLTLTLLDKDGILPEISPQRFQLSPKAAHSQGIFRLHQRVLVGMLPMLPRAYGGGDRLCQAHA